MSCPSNSTLPSARASGIVSCNRFRQRRKVDLPQPDGPMIAVTSRSRSSSVTLRTPVALPKYAVRSTASSRVRPRSGARRSIAGAGADSGSGDKAGNDTDDEHDGDEDERAGPSEPVPLVVRTDGVVEDLERQR